MYFISSFAISAIMDFSPSNFVDTGITLAIFDLTECYKRSYQMC